MATPDNSLAKLTRRLEISQEVIQASLKLVNRSTDVNLAIERQLAQLEDLVATLSNMALYEEWRVNIIALWNAYLNHLVGNYEALKKQPFKLTNEAAEKPIKSTDVEKNKVLPEAAKSSIPPSQQNQVFMPISDSETVKKSADAYVVPKERPQSPLSALFKENHQQQYSGKVLDFPNSYSIPASQDTLPPNSVSDSNLSAKKPLPEASSPASSTSSTSRNKHHSILQKPQGWGQTISVPQNQLPVKATIVSAITTAAENNVGGSSKPLADNDINWAAPPSIINVVKSKPQPEQQLITSSQSPQLNKPQEVLTFNSPQAFQVPPHSSNSNYTDTSRDSSLSRDQAIRGQSNLAEKQLGWIKNSMPSMPPKPAGSGSGGDGSGRVSRNSNHSENIVPPKQQQQQQQSKPLSQNINGGSQSNLSYYGNGNITNGRATAHSPIVLPPPPQSVLSKPPTPPLPEEPKQEEFLETSFRPSKFQPPPANFVPDYDFNDWGAPPS